MTAPMGLGAATKAGRWLKETTDMVATMTAMAARLPAIPPCPAAVPGPDVRLQRVTGHQASQPGRDIGGERRQFRASPRPERPAHPRVELVFGQPSLDERGLKDGDHPLAVGVRSPE